jgi:hypothetical protein
MATPLLQMILGGLSVNPYFLFGSNGYSFCYIKYMNGLAAEP